MAQNDNIIYQYDPQKGYQYSGFKAEAPKDPPQKNQALKIIVMIIVVIAVMGLLTFLAPVIFCFGILLLASLG